MLLPFVHSMRSWTTEIGLSVPIVLIEVHWPSVTNRTGTVPIGDMLAPSSLHSLRTLSSLILEKVRRGQVLSMVLDLVSHQQS